MDNLYGSDLALLKLQQQQKIDSEKLQKLNDRKLKEKTDEFESLIIKTLLDVSMKDSNELFGKDAGDKIYQSMFREQISKSTAGGFGISEILFNFLKENR
ncbi:MAG TPA: Rod binding protein [Campylobacterales bacterium]|nr:Rod binding protein [Campylobacterales bacterium]